MRAAVLQNILGLPKWFAPKSLLEIRSITIGEGRSTKEPATLACAEYQMENQPKNTCNIAFRYLPDTDDLRKYSFILYEHVSDCWYVDAGESCVESTKPGDYFYADKFCNVNKSNEYDEARDGVYRKIGIRTFYGINPYAEVVVDE